MQRVLRKFCSQDTRKKFVSVTFMKHDYNVEGMLKRAANPALQNLFAL